MFKPGFHECSVEAMPQEMAVIARADQYYTEREQARRTEITAQISDLEAQITALRVKLVPSPEPKLSPFAAEREAQAKTDVLNAIDLLELEDGTSITAEHVVLAGMDMYSEYRKETAARKENVVMFTRQSKLDDDGSDAVTRTLIVNPQLEKPLVGTVNFSDPQSADTILARARPDFGGWDAVQHEVRDMVGVLMAHKVIDGIRFLLEDSDAVVTARHHNEYNVRHSIDLGNDMSIDVSEEGYSDEESYRYNTLRVAQKLGTDTLVQYSMSGGSRTLEIADTQKALALVKLATKISGR